MATVFRPSNCVWQGSSTSTTGGTITLGVAALTGKLNFRDRFANGTTGVPLELYDSTTGTFEFSYGTLTYGGGGPTTDTISSRVVTYSTNGPGVPIAWGGGIRDAYCNVAAESFLFAENALAEMTAPQLASALARLGVTFGTAPGNAVRFDPSTGKYPAGDGSLITGLPASPIPSGTKLAGFYQAAAPSGWTQITTIDDMMLGVTNGSGTGGAGPFAGGTTSGTTWDPAPYFTVGGHQLVDTELPIFSGGASGSAVIVVSHIGIGAAHSHPITSNGNWRPPTAKTILCQKI